MDRRLVIPAALAALVAAAPARAQFRPAATRLPAWSQTQVGVGPIGGIATEDDLLLLGAGVISTTGYYPDGDLLTRGRPLPYAIPGVQTFDAALGNFDGGAVPDLVWEVATQSAGSKGGLQIAWGSAPGTTELFRDVYTYLSHGLAPLRLLPRPEPLLVATDVGQQPLVQTSVTLFDLKGVKGTSPSLPPSRTYSSASFYTPEDDEPSKDRVYALRASPAAVTPGLAIWDGAIPLMQGFRLLWNRTAAGATTIAGLALDYVDIGIGDPVYPFANFEPGLTLQPGSSCFGVAGLNVDSDNLPDLVFTMRKPSAPPGKLLWLHNTTTSPGLTTGTWYDMTSRAELQPLLDPRVLRQVELSGGATAVALHDVALDQILLISGDGATGFTVLRLPAFGGRVKELWTANVAGTSAPDLLVWVTAPGGGQEVWVYPDDADPTSWLAWAPAAPATAPLGTDLPLSVAAAAPGAAVTLLSTTPAAAAMQGETFTVPGSALCASTVDLRARASILRPGDDLGVLQEVQATVSLDAVPTLRIAGPGAPDGLVLAPGGASGRSEGAAWPSCQTATKPTYTWSQSGLPGLTPVAEQVSGSATAWRDFTVPESAYPILLSGALPPSVTLTASGPTTTSGNVIGSASLPLRLDARSLVSATVALDEAALSAGELGTARITLASRIGVALPNVRAEVKLAGLALVGEPHGDGAHAPGPGATAVVIDSLPASPETIELALAVRSLGEPGEVSVEVFSEGGHLLSPEASPAIDGPRQPGCGCGAGGVEGLPLALALALLRLASARRSRAT